MNIYALFKLNVTAPCIGMRGYAEIRYGIMSADADTNPAPSLASET